MEQVGEVAMSSPYDLLLGRKTYELFASHWETADGEADVAVVLNNAVKYVATNTLTELSWRNSVKIAGDIAKEIRSLKAQDGPLLQVHGSQQLIQLLLAHDLIDEYRLWVFPVAVGSGKRLFGNGVQLPHLTLCKMARTRNGALMTVYRREH